MNEFNIEQIEKLRIHELRDYARSVGISSPTTMKKQELITKINEVFQNNNNGCNIVKNEEDMDFFSLLTLDNSSIFNKLLERASKNTRKTDKIALVEQGNLESERVKTKIETHSPTEPYTFSGPEFVWKVAQNEPEYPVYTETMSGYLDIHPDGYGIVRKNSYIPDDEDVYLTASLIKKEGLKKGAFIKGKIKTIVVGKPKIMYEIEYNDIEVYKPRYVFDEMPFTPIGEELYLEKNEFKIRQGERIYCKGLDLDKCVNIAEELAEENSCHTKIFNFRSKPEDIYKGNQKMEIINCPFNRTEIEGLNAIELVLERVKREVELGRPFVVFLYNFSEMIRAFNVAFEGFYDFSKVNARALNKIKNLLYIAKNSINNMYVSIVCVDKNGIPSDLEDIMKLEFLPLFNDVR